MDFGAYGSYDLRAEIRASENLVTAKGVTVGQLRLPSGIVVSESMVEVMFPAGPREIRSFMRATLKANTKTIPVAISTVYSPLTDKEKDWTRKVPLQIRHSYVETPTSKGGKLAIRHATVIEACRVPAAPKSFSKSSMPDEQLVPRPKTGASEVA